SQFTTVDFGVFNNEVESTNSSILYNYIDRDGITSLGPLPPRDAGEYWLEISIDNQDQFFSAYKRFSYLIQKKEANIDIDSSYTYLYGEDFSIVPLISNSLSAKDYITQYFVSGQITPLTSKPSNVGRYRVAFNINHRNYYGSAETLLVINRVRLQLNVLPEIDSLEYGVKLGTAGFLGGEVVTNDSAATKINGTFSFVDPNATPPRGTQAVQVRFIPSNDNFEPITFSMDIIINKRSANINFISSNCVYNGMPQLPIIRTDPALGINTRFTVYKDGLQVNNAIEVGNYRVIATISDDNYEGFSILEVFQITKASAIISQSILPQASPIEFNQALNKSSLTGGSMVYVNNGLSVAGSFRYLNPDVMLGPVGTYNNIAYLFVPIDTTNYEIFESTLSIQVVKTNAVISAFDTVFVYGSQIRRPTFITNPANLNVTNDEFENEIENIIEVGTYRFTAFISDTNYKGNIVYNITVIKKSVEVQFYLGTVPVDSYRTTYGSIIYAKAKLKTTTLVPRDIQNINEIEENLQYFYGSSTLINQSLSVSPPVSIGEYRAYVKMNYRNYEINENSSWINYQVSRANVQRLEFDFTSLSTQVYGSVSMPNVLVTPSNVTVRVSFPGYPDMPTTAGTHSIRVEVIDPNYNPSFRNGTFIILPRQISIENIKAFDKAVDGLSDIKVTGSLGGVLQGDEVFLEMKARTEDNLIDVGTHTVIIDSWTLKGLHASNYSVRPPVYLLHVKITNKVVKDPATDSYITSAAGFNSNVTVSFKDVYDTINRTNFLTSLIGQKATVQTISIKENGLNTVLEEKVKFYIRIPEEYLNSENLEVKGLGNLSNQSITFTREGDYMTFYADTSGEIIFYNNDFPYWIIIVVSSVILVVVGVILLFVLIPKKRRKVISSGARKAYEWTQEAKELDNKAEVLSRIKEKEKKRRWRL
ncbi:MAG: MBG domain-containing protein, partial [Clostridia bacterium]